MKAKTFKIYIDRKETIWQRYFYTVTAESRKEAEQLITEEAVANELPDSGNVKFEECDTLYDTGTIMTESENGGEPVMEIFHDDGKQIMTK